MKKFTIDGAISAFGQDLGDRWNGWRTPNFPRDQWESLLQQMKECGWEESYSEINGKLISDKCEQHDNECDPECEHREYWEINPEGFCALGAWSWIWSVDETESDTPCRDQVELIRKIANSMEDLSDLWDQAFNDFYSDLDKSITKDLLTCSFDEMASAWRDFYFIVKVAFNANN